MARTSRMHEYRHVLKNAPQLAKLREAAAHNKYITKQCVFLAFSGVFDNRCKVKNKK
jgi:hypothetical protein